MSPPIALSKFGGLLPRVPDTALPVNSAMVAENLDFGYGELRSLKGDFRMRDLAVAARSVFSEDGLRFYAWSEDVDAVVSPLQNGPASDRLYYTTGSDFRVTALSLATVGGSSPTTSFRVGVPRPKNAPRVSVQHPEDPKAPPATVDPLPADTYAERLKSAQASADAIFNGSKQTSTETRVYTFTYENAYNEEGPPSDAVTVEVKSITVNGATVTSTVTVEVDFDGAGEYVPITGARLYRTANAASSTDYFYAMTIRPGSPRAIDAVKAGALNEPLSSLDSYPPDPALKGVFNIGNGILCAWKGRELWFCEAYRPWAWPPQYVVTVKYPIIGAAQHASGALVTTVGEPCIVSGVSPDAMVQIPLDISQAGTSKWSLISMGGLALYACHDGLVAIDGGSPSFTLSERFFTREVWRARYGRGLGSMQFARYDGKLIVFSKNDQFVPFIIDLSQDGGQMAEIPGFSATTALVLTTSDQMYTVKGTGLYQFGGGADLPLRWKTGEILLPGPAVLAAARVECVGEFTIKFYQNGKLGYTETVQTGVTTFRLPSDGIPGHDGLEPSDRWQFEITGTGRFKWLRAASSIRGLKEP